MFTCVTIKLKCAHYFTQKCLSVKYYISCLIQCSWF